MVISTNVLIVGAGPIGIELAVALKRAGIAYRHIEAGQIGSTMSWWAPGTTFFSSPERVAIADVPLETLNQTKASREEYLTYLRSVVRQYSLEIQRNTRVVSLRKDGDTFRARLVRSYRGVGEPAAVDAKEDAPADSETQDEISALKVVLAIGDMHRPNRLNIPGEDLPRVSHYFRDPHTYFGERVVIVGGKNSAAEAAIRLHRIGCNVTLVHRRPALDDKRIKYWIYPELRSLIKTTAIAFLPSTVLESITGSHAAVCNTESGQRAILQYDHLLLLTGYVQNKTLFESAGVRLEGERLRPFCNRQTMETNVPGLFVAGTAVAGSQVSEVREFIETSHDHVARILSALTGGPPPPSAASEFEDLES